VIFRPPNQVVQPRSRRPSMRISYLILRVHLALARCVVTRRWRSGWKRPRRHLSTSAAA
jgi:hypothetical protein